jgi:hypothetical protein
MIIIPELLDLMLDNAESCFDSCGIFDPPKWLQKKCWPVIAKSVPAFFSDAYNGDEDFERAIMKMASDRTLDAVTDAITETHDILCRSAIYYMQQYADDVLIYLTRPEPQYND